MLHPWRLRFAALRWVKVFVFSASTLQSCPDSQMSFAWAGFQQHTVYDAVRRILNHLLLLLNNMIIWVVIMIKHQDAHSWWSFLMSRCSKSSTPNKEWSTHTSSTLSASCTQQLLKSTLIVAVLIGHFFLWPRTLWWAGSIFRAASKI